MWIVVKTEKLITIKNNFRYWYWHYSRNRSWWRLRSCRTNWDM